MGKWRLVKFLSLAPTLIKNDPFGQPVINNKYNAEMLAGGNF